MFLCLECKITFKSNVKILKTIKEVFLKAWTQCPGFVKGENI